MQRPLQGQYISSRSASDNLGVPLYPDGNWTWRDDIGITENEAITLSHSITDKCRRTSRTFLRIVSVYHAKCNQHSEFDRRIDVAR